MNKGNDQKSNYDIIQDVLYALNGLESDTFRLSIDSFVLNNKSFLFNSSQASSINKIALSTTSTSTAGLATNGALPTNPVAHLAAKFLPLCSNCYKIHQFIERNLNFDYGRILHAFCAALRGLMDDFSDLIMQIHDNVNNLMYSSHNNDDNGEDYSLQQLYFTLQPSSRTIQYLAKIVDDLDQGSIRGVEVINYLLKEKESHGNGDSRISSLFSFLIRKTSKPFMDMLEKWIHDGRIDDPFGEFMVFQDEASTKATLSQDFNARFWESHFSLRDKKEKEDEHEQGDDLDDLEKEEKPKSTPLFISEDLAEKILVTGKYLNVVRESGKWSKDPNALTVTLDGNKMLFEEAVKRAYNWSSKSLLSMLIVDHHFMDYIRIMKFYFLFSKGDFFVHLMDVAESQLEKPVSEISLGRINFLLQQCLRDEEESARELDATSEKDNQTKSHSFGLKQATSLVTCSLFPDSLSQYLTAIHRSNDTSEFALSSSSTAATTALSNFLTVDERNEKLTGINTFSLDFKIGWPLSILLSRAVITKYQLLFRLLFFSKYVERYLSKVWILHQSKKSQKDAYSIEEFILRSKMVNIVQSFNYYVTYEVIEPHWNEFEEKIEKDTITVDNLKQHHEEFLDKCLRESLISNWPMLHVLLELLHLCLDYAKFAIQDAEAFAEENGNEIDDDEKAMRAENKKEIIHSYLIEFDQLSSLQQW